MVWMTSYSQMEGIFATDLGQILVCTDTSSFKGFRGELFVFVGNEVDTEREFIDTRLLTSQIEDPNLSRESVWVHERTGDYKVPLGQGHHDCIAIWGMACFYLEHVSPYSCCQNLQ